MPQMTYPKVLVIEGPNALDLLQGRGERGSLEQVCGLFGHDVASLFVHDGEELRKALAYVGAISRHPGAGSEPLIVHVSVHGDANGLTVGPDDVTWEELAEMTVEMYSNLDRYRGPVVLVLSACGASEQELTDLLESKRGDLDLLNPPEYVFVFTDESVRWTDAVVAWTIFYSQIGRIRFDIYSYKDIRKIQKLLGRLHKSALAKLTYFRWDGSEEAYKIFDSKRAKKNKR